MSELLPCPLCHSNVVRAGMDIVCNGCGAVVSFPICSVTTHLERLWNTRTVAPCTLEPTTWQDPSKLPDIPVGSEREFICAVYRKHSGKVYTFSATYLNAYRLNYEWGCPNEKSQHICDECEDGCPTTGWFTLTGADDEGSQYHSLNLRDGDELRGWRALPAWDAAPPPQSAASTVEQGNFMTLVHRYGANPTQEGFDAIYSRYLGDCGAAPTTSPEPDAVRALFEPAESNATDNLEGALIDIKRFKEAGQPTDDVCIRTIERVIKQLTKAEAALSRPAHGGWEDISTAPKDGTPILIPDDRYEKRPPTIARWNDQKYHNKPKPYWSFIDERVHGVGMSRAYQPSVWQPLPAPPVARNERSSTASRCPHCDDTGDVHRADGEWLGSCDCKSARNERGGDANG